MVNVEKILKLQASLDSAFHELHAVEVDSPEAVCFLTKTLNAASSELLSCVRWLSEDGYRINRDIPSSVLPENGERLYKYWASCAISLSDELGDAICAIYDRITSMDRCHLMVIRYIENTIKILMLSASSMRVGEFANSGVDMCKSSVRLATRIEHVDLVKLTA